MCWDLTGMPAAIAEMDFLETLDRYVVDPHNGGLRYLKNLNKLCGSLSIELPRLWEKTAEEAEQANLKSKHGLTSVKFKWSGAYKGDDGNDNYDVLDKLKPCTSIETLSIINFGGKAFPNWVTSLGMENHLTEIVISRCRGCRILPPFHKMPKLMYLTLTSMDIEYLQDGDNNNSRCDASADTVFFPSLYKLKIGRMPKLIGWPRDMSSLSLTFSGLGFVEIWDCPRLTIQGFDKLETLPEALLRYPQRLSQLAIMDCKSLKLCFRFSGFSQSLEALLIENCPGTKYLSDSLRHLVMLTKLEISNCSEELDCLYKEDEDGMPWKDLQRLNELTIEGFKNLAALPKGLQHLDQLSVLQIRDCKNLKGGLDSLPQLEVLYIESCPHFSKEPTRQNPYVEVIEGKPEINFFGEFVED